MLLFQFTGVFAPVLSRLELADKMLERQLLFHRREQTMIKEILPDRPKKLLAPSSHHYLVSVSFAWKQLLKQQNSYKPAQRLVHQPK